MGENKNPLLEETKEQPKQEGKIGFHNAEPVSKKGQKAQKFQDKLPGKKLRKWATFCTVMGIIFSSITAMYLLLPIFSALIGGLIAFVLIMFMIFSVIVTLGIALTIEDYRYWIGNHMMDVPNWFFNVSENTAKLAPYFYVPAIPALIFTITGLILGIVGKAKGYKFFTSHIILNSIFLTIALLFTILFLAAGIVGTNA